MLTRLSLKSLVCAVVLVGARPAMAQQEPDEPNREAARSDRDQDQPENEARRLRLQPVTVTATRQARTLVETPANVSAVTKQELGRRMDNVLEDVFRYEPGIEVSRQTSGTDPFSSSGGIQIRGVGGNRTQVLVDGGRTIERITDSTRDVVDASNVKAVEVVRGPASVLWGSDGLGGVVNYVTKDPEDYLADDERFGGSASFDFASLDDAFTESVTGAFRLSSDVEALLSYTRRDAGEIELRNARLGEGAVQACTRAPEATPCNRFDPLASASNNVLGKLVWKPSDTNQLRLTGDYFNRDTDVDQNSVLGPSFNFFGEQTATVTSFERTQEIERWRVSLDQEWLPDSALVDRLNWRFTYSPQQVNRNGDRRRTLFSSGDEEQRLDDQEFMETFIELDAQVTSSFELAGTEHILTYGFDGDRAKTDFNRIDTTRKLTQGTETVVRAGGFNFADATTIRADGYIQDEISLFDARLKLIPGVRLAYYAIDPEPDGDFQLVPGAEPREIDKTDVQFKLGAIVQLTPALSVYGQFSEGFKMPTAQQLFQSVDSLPFFALVPNPDLQPERVDNFEAGIRGDFGDRGYFSVNGFYADYDNFIRNFVDADPEDFGLPPGSQVLTYDNVDKVEIYGIEASAVFSLTETVSTRLALSYQEGNEEEDGEESEYLGALPFNAVVGLRYLDRERGLDVEFVATFQAGDPAVNDPETEFSPGGFAVFDLLGSWEVWRGVVVKAALFNIFDKRYFPAETRGLPINVSDAVSATNPIELQTAPGRNFKVGLVYEF